jgi:hypothetical protein
VPDSDGGLVFDGIDDIAKEDTVDLVLVVRHIGRFCFEKAEDTSLMLVWLLVEFIKALRAVIIVLTAMALHHG